MCNTVEYCTANVQPNQSSHSCRLCGIFQKYLESWLRLGDVYLVFDRYIDFSTKCSAHKARSIGGCRAYKLSTNAPLPPQKQVLTVSETKKQLINNIVEKLASDSVVPGGYEGKLVIKGQDCTPIEISPGGVVIG